MNDLIRVVALVPAVMASGSLTYLVGYGVASFDSYQVGSLLKRMMLTKATCNAELMVWDCR